MKEKILMIMGSQAIKTFLVSAFILFIIYYLITRHLSTMGNFTKILDFEHLNQNLVLNRKPSAPNSPDELDRVVTAINTMMANLNRSYRQLDDYSKSLEQKVDERTRELKEAQYNLIQQAHEAGMAEMAVGILHNIGNALTPARVITSLTIQKLQDSAIIKNLNLIALRIQEYIDKTSDLSNEEKNNIRKILNLLPKSIQEEYDDIIEEIQKIREKNLYIESIINLQMRYARLVDSDEWIDAREVIDDAIKMLEESIRKRSITIEKEYADIPLIRFDRSKLMQIAVNVVKNGFEAMEDDEITDKRLVITVVPEEGPEMFIKCSFRDFGTGFTQEDKAQLFSFGFSTKSRGSGFGLHSCANYLNAKNGSITAHSNGPGTGAEFLIRLPVKTEEETETIHSQTDLELPSDEPYTEWSS